MEGFSELIPQELINVFDERELELLIGGISESTILVSVSGWTCTNYLPFSWCGWLGQIHRLSWIFYRRPGHQMVLAVHSQLATRAQVASATIRYRYLTNTRQRLQRPSRIRWSKTFHYWEERWPEPVTKESHLFQQSKLSCQLPTLSPLLLDCMLTYRIRLTCLRTRITQVWNKS